MSRRSWWAVGGYIGLLTGLVVAAVMTFLDWRANPGGIFHDESGTNWAFLGETALSWFWPVALVSFLLAVTLHATLAWLRHRQP